MSVSAINLSIAIGQLVPSPAPSFIAEALESVEVSFSDDGPGAFQLSFRADRRRGYTSNYELLESPLLKPSNRVVLTVSVNGVPSVLMDGIITRQELVHQTEVGAATLAITGEDVSVLMDLVEYSIEYPAMGDAAIAALILVKYTMVGIVPAVVPTLSSLIPLAIERVPQQMATDRAHLTQLAAQNGYVFHVRPGPAYLTNTAYWGPPLRTGTPQPALSVDQGPETNVESLSFQYDALAPTLVAGFVQDVLTELDLPVVTLGSSATRLPPLASQPALPNNLPFVRYQQFVDTGLTAFQAYDYAQAVTDLSTDRVVTVQGRLNAVRYGGILKAPGLVGVRGAGASYDGNYYVKSVTHRIRNGDYTQDFTLTREGVGSLTSEVNP